MGEIPDVYKYLELLRLGEPKLLAARSCKEPAISAAISAFGRNTARLQCLVFHTPACIRTTVMSHRLTTQVNMEVCGKPIITVNEIAESGKLAEWMEKHQQAYLAAQQSEDEGDNLPSMTNHFIQGVGFLNRILQSAPNSNFHISMSAIFASIVSGAWTAFEAIAGDLWASAVNARPHSLGIMTIDSQAEDSGVDESEGKKSGKNARAFTSERLRELMKKHGLSLADKMGTIVRQEKRSTFNRLEGLQAYYRLTFGKPGEEVFLRYPDLAGLEAIRNVIVHQGGRVDEFFRERAKEHAPHLLLPVGDDLPIDGELVARYAVAGFSAGSDLACFVNKWLSENPDKPNPVG